MQTLTEKTVWNLADQVNPIFPNVVVLLSIGFIYLDFYTI